MCINVPRCGFKTTGHTCAPEAFSPSVKYQNVVELTGTAPVSKVLKPIRLQAYFVSMSVMVGSKQPCHT
jgi:hypothetical protein